jgi:hypothetical protein
MDAWMGVIMGWAGGERQDQQEGLGEWAGATGRWKGWGLGWLGGWERTGGRHLWVGYE